MAIFVYLLNVLYLLHFISKNSQFYTFCNFIEFLNHCFSLLNILIRLFQGFTRNRFKREIIDTIVLVNSQYLFIMLYIITFQKNMFYCLSYFVSSQLFEKPVFQALCK